MTYSKLLHELLSSAAARHSDSVAVECGSAQLTYSELDAKSNRLAHYLQSLGAAPEVIVGVHLQRSVELVVALLAVLKSGAAYLPLECASPMDRRALMLTDSRAKILLTHSQLHTYEASDGIAVVQLDKDWGSIAAYPAVGPSNRVRSDNLAYVIYTSGSTGKPKGVMVTHRGLVNYLLWAARLYRAMDGNGAPICTSIAFDATVTSLYLPLLSGRRVLMLPETDVMESLETALVGDHDWTLLKVTPAHLKFLKYVLDRSTVAGQVRTIVVGGEALRATTIEWWRKHAPSTKLINEYGPTETVVGCCVYEVNEGTDHVKDVPIGRSIANTKLYVLDQEQKPVSIGTTGELYIGSVGVARGYLGAPALTAERFVPNPFGDGDRLYRTGDLVRWDHEGQLEFIGRADQQVKIRGFRVEPGEIEMALAEHSKTQDVAVIGYEDRYGDNALGAFVVAEQGENLASSELKDHLRSRLPDYMVPATIVQLKQLPRTPNDKIDRHALLRRYKDNDDSARVER